MEGNMILLISTLYPFAGALISYLIGRKNKTARDYVADFIAISEAAGFLFLFIQTLRGAYPDGISLSIPGVFGMGLYLTLDGFRSLYALIAAFMWMMCTIFGKEYFAHYRNRNRYYLFLLMTLGATIGVFLSADLFTTFIFFEIMSFTSYVWVAHDEKQESLRAAETYLAVAVIGGLVMLMGLFLLYNAIGTLRMSELLRGVAAFEGNKNVLYAAGACMLFGFGAKAGAFPLHIWLPKAHPVAPAPASALLSGILTKAGIFGILVVSCNIFFADMRWGTLILIIGVLTMVVGAILALFSIDLKRTLACSSVSQIGFIMVGIGMGCLLGEENAMAVHGALLHMVNHSLIKLTLFMAAGVVFMNLHKLDLNAIRGFGHKKPLLNFCFLMGTLGIAGVPLWNGYVSKTLIHESIVEYIELFKEGLVSGAILNLPTMQVIEWVFLISGGLTVAYMTKLYVVLFVEHNKEGGIQKQYDDMKGHYMNKASAFALIGSAIVLPILGFFPHLTMDVAANVSNGFLNYAGESEAVAYLSMNNIKGGLISIFIGLGVYFFIVRMLLMSKKDGKIVYLNRWPKWLDLENALYRPVLLKVLPFIGGVASRIADRVLDSIVVFLRKTIYRDSKLPHELEEGTYLTHVLGMTMDEWNMVLNHTVRRHHPKEVSYEHKLALVYEEEEENTTIIRRSMSYGLLLFCIGFIATLIYLIWF